MSDICAVIVGILLFAIPIQILIFIIRWIMGKSKKGLGISILVSLACFVLFTLMGALSWDGTAEISKKPETAIETMVTVPPSMESEPTEPPTTEPKSTASSAAATMAIEPSEAKLEQIDNAITTTLLSKGYTVDHASKIQEILNAIGISEIAIENMTGSAESGLNAVVCYPNGYTSRDRRFWFTTEDGVLFFAGFHDEPLYDIEEGGYLKNYSDVHVPEKEVTYDVYVELRGMAETAVKQHLNYPDTANFSIFDWKVGRSDNRYQIMGKVMAANGFGVKDDVQFSVWFVASAAGYVVEGISLNGVRVK